ncbi:MAG: selenite/tellurite reduction operon porin ExtI [Nitrospiraceae bacterium]|nr:selenite/tellurite reduction operon porin ExtI [Nitrospiraceae bacterium]
MKGAQKKFLLLALFAVSFFLAAGNAFALPPIVFGNEGAFLKIDYQGQLYGVWRDTGSGASKQNDSTDIFFRRNRLSFWAHGTSNYGAIVQLEYVGERNINDLTVSDVPGSSLEVLDAYFMWDFSNEFRVYAGKQKIQLTRENLEDCFEPLSLDRSLFIYTLKHSRDTGLVLWGNLPDIKSQYRVEVSKGNDGNNSPQSGLMYTARFHVSLWDPEYAYGYKGTYLGKKKVLTIGVGGQFEPDAVYADSVSHTGAKTYYAYTADAFMEYPLAKGTSAVTLSGAYLKESFNNAYQGSNPDPNSIGQDGEKNGWYVKAAYLLPGRIGPGQVQPFVRYEEWKYADMFNVFDQKINWTGAGVNYLIDGQSLRVTVQYSRTDFNKEVNAQSQSFNTVTAMLQYRF